MEEGESPNGDAFEGVLSIGEMTHMRKENCFGAANALVSHMPYIQLSHVTIGRRNRRDDRKFPEARQ